MCYLLLVTCSLLLVVAACCLRAYLIIRIPDFLVINSTLKLVDLSADLPDYQTWFPWTQNRLRRCRQPKKKRTKVFEIFRFPNVLLNLLDAANSSRLGNTRQICTHTPTTVVPQSHIQSWVRMSSWQQILCDSCFILIFYANSPLTTDLISGPKQRRAPIINMHPKTTDISSGSQYREDSLSFFCVTEILYNSGQEKS